MLAFKTLIKYHQQKGGGLTLFAHRLCLNRLMSLEPVTKFPGSFSFIRPRFSSSGDSFKRQRIE